MESNTPPDSQVQGGICMNRIHSYISKITSELPISMIEREELEFEMFTHMEDHVNELVSNGWTQERAIEYVIESFGDEFSLNKEMKTILFPFYKFVRFFIVAILLTASMFILSFGIMKYYTPEMTMAYGTNEIVGYTLLVFLVAGVAEVLYEAIHNQFKIKWLENPWVFFLSVGILMTIPGVFSMMEEPPVRESWERIDYFSILIGTIIYLFYRQIFTSLVPMVIKKRQTVK